jgi:Sortilin, neurotensin receptor 3,/BNR/Asp-box repeat
VLAGGGEEEAPHVFVSTDGGQTWTQPIPDPPYRVNGETLLLSPAFAVDRTAFTGVPWEKPQRTIGGREWEAFGPPGNWNLAALQISPAFDRDGLLFMLLEDNSLWRSTDRGDTWTKVAGPWGSDAPLSVTHGTGYVLAAITFSPAYAQDGVLLTSAGNALYRSTDQGATWTKVLDLGFPPIQAIFTPDYARSGTVYFLQNRTLYRSADRGKTWKALPPTPWEDYAEIWLLLSPTFSQDQTMLAWKLYSGPVYQSSDGGKSWREASAGLAVQGLREVVFSPDYAADGLIYAVPYEGGIYKQVGGSAWVPVTERTLPPTPTHPPTPAPTPPPTATAAPVACAVTPTRFRAVWQQAQARLGCPEGEAEQVMLAEQPFEQGRMIWDSSTSQIDVLSAGGRWQAFDDTFVDGMDPAYDPALPPPPKQPQRGFGKVWRDQLGGPQAAIGWALEDERAVNGWRQRFEHGLLVWTDAVLEEAKGAGTAYLLYDDGTWQAIAAFAP